MSDWYLTALLRLFPRKFRRQHGEEIRHDVAAERGQRPTRLARAALWFEITIDLLRSARRVRAPYRHQLLTHPRTATSGGVETMASVLQDLRHAVRALLRTPVTSLVIVLTLALGIGMNTSIFSVVNAVLLRPFEYREPDRLVHIGANYASDGVFDSNHAGGIYRRIQASSDTLVEVAAVRNIQQNLSGVPTPLQAQVGWVSDNIFSMLGVSAIRGRLFSANDPPGLAVLSHRLWQTTFTADPEAIGQVVALDGVPYTIIGVLPAEFRLRVWSSPRRIDIWKLPDNVWANGDVWDATGLSFSLLKVFGRLHDDATIEQARDEMGAIADQVREEYSEYREAGFDMSVVPLLETVVGNVRPTLLLLMGAVGFVLLIACANIVGLMLVRAQGRQREMLLRLALGSPRSRIVRLLLSEALVLTLVGGAIGATLAVATTDLLASFRPDGLPRLDAVTMDLRVLGFALAATLVCTLVFGLAPATTIGRTGLVTRLAGNRSTPRLGRLRDALVVVQIALSVVLLIGAGLLTASLMRLRSVDPGFQTTQLLTFSISLPGARYEWPAGTGRFHRQLEERIETLPGVTSAGVIWPLPLTDIWSGQYVAGDVTEEDRAPSQYRLATPGFFATVGIPIRSGRGLESTDAAQVAIISRALAERSWPSQNPLGRHVRADPWGRGLTEFEVIGVANDVRYRRLREAPMETIYFDSRNWSWVDWEVDFVVSSQVEPLALVDPIRELLSDMDAEIPMAEVQTMAAYVDARLAPNRYALALVGLFASVAGLLAMLGLYGVVSHGVGERTREIGIRMALGSDRGHIARLILTRGARLSFVGLTLGLAGSLGLTRLLTGFLFGVAPTDPTTFITISVALLAVSLTASYLPARRAVRLDVITVLRTE